MKWNIANNHPEEYKTIVLLCENGKIYFDGMLIGDEYEVWDDENEINDPPKEKVIGWMYQSELENFLLGLNMS